MMKCVQILFSKYGGILFSIFVLNTFTIAQKTISLDAKEGNARMSVSINQVPTNNDRHLIAARAFRINPLLQIKDGVSVGDEIELYLFEKKQYRAVVERVSTDVNETVIVQANLPAYPTGYVLLSTNLQGKSLVTIEIPELEEHYSSISLLEKEESYLVQFASVEHDHSTCGGAVLPEELIPIDTPTDAQSRVSGIESSCTPPTFAQNISTNADIRILVVYTAAAMAWSNSNHGGISNTVSNGLGLVQTVWNNSGIGATITLAHSALVDYNETGDLSIDLNNLQQKNDGLLDYIQHLRIQHTADLVSLIVAPNNGNAAGIAYLLTNKNGNYDWAYSVIMANYFNSLTTPHELGHNMGMHHDVENSSSNTVITPYAYGWRWNGTNSVQYRSVMAYAPGTRVNYFSSPIQNFQGRPMGDVAVADNARLGREVKHIIADYKHKLSHIPDVTTNLKVVTTTDNGATLTWDAVAGVTGYRVAYFYQGSWWTYGVITATSFSFSSSHFEPGNTYRWRVETVGECLDVRGVSTESIFTTTNSTLPVSFIAFEAKVSENGVILHWNTSSESGARYFEVQRSNDGSKWETLGSVTTKGILNTVSNYQFVDDFPNHELNYYRLKVVDIDQSFEYSKIISVILSNSPFWIYPNPASSEIVLNGLKGIGIESLQMTKINGDILFFEMDIQSNKIDVQSLPPGLYVLQVNYTNGERISRKFLVHR